MLLKFSRGAPGKYVELKESVKSYQVRLVVNHDALFLVEDMLLHLSIFLLLHPEVLVLLFTQRKW